jgi:hypothetical protein
MELTRNMRNGLIRLTQGDDLLKWTGRPTKQRLAKHGLAEFVTPKDWDGPMRLTEKGKAKLAAERAQGMRKRAAEHGVGPGARVLRLSRTREDGSEWTCLFLYDTAAAHHEADWGAHGQSFTREWVEWDGAEYLDLDNGD